MANVTQVQPLPSPSGQQQVVGWISGPNTRGTMDIVWGSFLTIFLCTWTVICLNLPSPGESNMVVAKRKAKRMFWAIVGPELVLSVAIGQFASARRSVQRFRDLGYQQWSLRHAFFADMGGITLSAKDYVPFPVNSRQLAYLVQHGHIEYPHISVEEIWDKSKADTLSKTLTLCQASWLLINVIGRGILSLPVTTLELSASAITFCTLGTSICWMRKPSDVKQGITLVVDKTIAEILIAAGDASREPYRHTPLDFVAKQSFTFGFDVMGFFGFRCDERVRPITRFPDDRFPDINTWEKLALFCITTIYSALHLVGWQFEFPSHTELICWRASSLIILVTTVLFWSLETIAARQRFGRWDKYWAFFRRIHNRLFRFGASANLERRDVETQECHHVDLTGKHRTAATKISQLDAFEAEQQNSKPLPAWEVMTILPVLALYAVARAYMIIEPLVGLRKLPLATYDTFQLSEILPHL